ncbi:SNF2 domain-containing protein CLASSY 2 [Nymphaea thermarum]|nr:SNF2 domain-containing protein CLASSY 2 [Nymphaea thermarum]
MEAFNHGAWWGARSVRIQEGRVIVDFDNQNLCSQETSLDKLRWRSRKATPSDCGYFLKPGVEVAVLSSSPSAISKEDHNLGGEDFASCFGDNKVSSKFKSASLSGQVITQGSSVYFIMALRDAKIICVKKEPHQDQCTCSYFVNFRKTQDRPTRHGVYARNKVMQSVSDFFILQKLRTRPCKVERLQREHFEDCHSLCISKLTSGNWRAEISWLVVISILRGLDFDLKLRKNKTMYVISNKFKASYDGRSVMAISFEWCSGILKPKFEPCDEGALAMAIIPVDVNSVDKGESYVSHYNVIGPRRSQRQRKCPDRFVSYGFESVYDNQKHEGAGCLNEEEKEDEDEEEEETLHQILGRLYIKNRNKRKHTDCVDFEDDRGICVENSIPGENTHMTNNKLVSFSNFMELKQSEGQTMVPEHLLFCDIGSTHNIDDRISCYLNENKLPTEADKYIIKQNSKRRRHVHNDVFIGRDLKQHNEDDHASVPDSFTSMMENFPGSKGAHNQKVIEAASEDHNFYNIPKHKKKTKSTKEGKCNKQLEVLRQVIDCEQRMLPLPVSARWEMMKRSKQRNVSINVLQWSPPNDVENTDSDLDSLWEELEHISLHVPHSPINENSCLNLSQDLTGKEWNMNRLSELDEDLPGKFNLRNITNNSARSEDVWSLIPDMRSQLHVHQKKAFEFIWKNIAGSVEIGEMDHTSGRAGGCIISHSPGTGKTLLVIAFLKSYLSLFPGNRPLVLVPKVTLYTWTREFEKWDMSVPVYELYATRDYQVMNSRKGEASNGLLGGLKLPVGMKRIMDCLEKLCKWHESPSILLMSYSCFSSFTSPRKSDNDLTRKIAGLLCRRPGILILDEGHKPRSIESILRKTLMNVTTNLRILLSGTLFQNNFEEYFNSLCLARPAFIQEVLNEFQPAISVSKSVKRPSARERRSMAKEKLARSIFIEEIASRINSEEEEDRKNGLEKLHRMTDGFIDVYEGRLLDSLPGLQTYTILLKPTLLQQKILSKLETLKNKLSLEIEPMITSAAIHVWLVKTISNSRKFFSRRDLDIDKYKTDINHGSKIRFIVDLLKLCVHEKEKALIFCRYIPPIYLLVEIFSKIFRWEVGKEVLVLQGNQDTVERSIIMDKFSDREGCCHVLLASTTACSEGINLTAASRLVLLDSEWNPSKTKQAIARAFRLGQEKIVYVYRLLAAGTLEEEKHERTAWKELLSRMVFRCEDISGSSYKQTKHIEDDMLRELVVHDHAKMFHSIMKHDNLALHDAKIISVKREPHQDQCTCSYFVNFRKTQGRPTRHGVYARNKVMQTVSDFFILQKLRTRPCKVERLQREHFEDCHSLCIRKLTSGNWGAEISWLVVISILIGLDFDLKLKKKNKTV